MRKSISILLLFTLTFGFLIKSVIIINFQINKTNIIAKYCINKDKPEMACSGKCYLSEQLSSTSPMQSSSTLPESIVQYEISTFIVPVTLYKNSCFSLLTKIHFESLKGLLLNGYLTKLFKPPILLFVFLFKQTN